MLLSAYLCIRYEETSLHIGSIIVPDGCVCRGRSFYCPLLLRTLRYRAGMLHQWLCQMSQILS